MFKRIEKRRRRQQEEEELGLDGDMKELLGMHDTDSDESESSADSEDSDAEQDPSDVDLRADGDEDEGDELSSDREDAGASDDDGPPISIAESLKNPIYSVSLETEAKACIACPGKSLKHMAMAEVHKESQAHIRRYTRFVELAKRADPEDDIRDIVRAQNATSGQVKQQDPGDLSKRAQKRREKQAMIKAKRELQKTMKAKAKARKEAKAANPTASSPSPTKQPTVDANTSDSDTESQSSPPRKSSKPKGSVADSRTHAKRAKTTSAHVIPVKAIKASKPLRQKVGERAAASIKDTSGVVKKKRRRVEDP